MEHPLSDLHKWVAAEKADGLIIFRDYAFFGRGAARAGWQYAYIGVGA